MHEWVENCRQVQQPLNFTHVGTHHANGKEEHHMCELQEIAQMQLIHVNQRCPGDFSAPTAIHPAP